MSKTNINGEEISVITSDIEGAKYSSSPTTGNLINESIPSWLNVIEFQAVNSSNNVAYVSNTGISPGVTPQVGNPLKPYTTIQDGLNAVGSYGRVIVAPGTYAENITSNNVIGLSLIMNGVILNGNASIFAGASGFKYIEMYGSTINGTFRLDNGYLKGGRINGYGQFFSADVYDLIINNTGGIGLNGGNTNKFFNCEITSSSIAVKRTTNSEFHNCVISGTSAWEDLFSTSTVFDNCDLISTGQTIIGANGVVKALIHNCNIKSDTAENIAFALDSNELKVTNSNFSSPTNNLLISANNLNRTINEQTVFESCSFVAGTGAILVEPPSYLTDAGTTLFINCTINKAAVTNVAPIRVTEHNTFSYLNLQDFA